MLLEDVIMQDCLNKYRLQINLNPIDFSYVNSIEDLEEFNVSLD